MFRLTVWLSIAILAVWPAWAPVAALAQGQPLVQNEFIQAQVGTPGQFTIGTLQGDPAVSADDERRLMYGHGSGRYTSFTSVRLVQDGGIRDVPLLQPTARPVPDADGRSITSAWEIEDVRVEQILAPASNPYTGRQDTFQITTRATNRSGEPVEVGVRVMLDTMIGDNDDAPFFIPGTGNTDLEHEFGADAMPAYWKAFEAPDYDPNSLKGQGILTGFGATPPDRFILARWPVIRASVWDYEVEEGRRLGDSAVAMYWMPQELAPGASAEWITFYGLAGSGGGEAWIDAPVNVTSQAPEFEATLWVSNLADADFVGGEASLALPPGLALAPGETERKSMPTVPVNAGAQSVSWRLVAAGEADADYAYSGTVTFESGSPPLTADAEIHYQVVAPTPLTPEPTTAPAPVAAPPPGGGFSWWPWLLLLPLVGLPLLWLLLRRPARPARSAPPPAVRPRPAPPLAAGRPTRRPGPTGADVTHGRGKRPK